MADPRNPSSEQPWPAERAAEPEIDRENADRVGDNDDIVGFSDDEDDDDVDPDSAESENDRDDMLDDA